MARQKEFKLSGKGVRSALIMFSLFMAIGIWRYLATGGVFYLGIFGYIGSSIAVGEILGSSLAHKHKPWGRRVTQILIGLFMLGFIGIVAHENMQLEGALFYLYGGIFAGASLHYLIAKMVGPVFFGRGWCGWACWTMMVMDLLPWKRPEKGRIRHLGWLRYLHFFVVLATVSALAFMTSYGTEGHARAELEWLLIGNVAYYLIALLLAVSLHDNRAFCKYVCPVPVSMKVLSRYSLLKQEIDMEKCIDCGLCEKHCIMDIKLLDYAREGQRVLSSECVLCNSCNYVCPTGAVSTTKSFDGGWTEYLNVRGD